MYILKTKIMMYVLTIGLIKHVCAMGDFGSIESALAAKEDTPSLDDGRHCTIIKCNGSIFETKMDIATVAKTSQIIIDLSNRNLDYIPDSFFDFNTDVLMRITDLCLCNDPLKNLPKSMKKLKWLRKLDLENTSISKLPKWFCELTALVSLDIRNNPCLKLPVEIVNLPNLKSVWFDDDQFNNLINKRDKGDKDVLSFLNTLEKKGVRICAPTQQKKLSDQKYKQEVNQKFNFEEYFKSIK